MQIDRRTGLPSKQKPGTPQKLLTIGMANHADYVGFAFTMAHILQTHREVIPYVEFVVLDNAPTTGDGMDVKRFVERVPNAHYVTMLPYKGTMGAKEMIIRSAQTEYVLVIDSHVLLDRGSLHKTLRFLTHVGLTNDLFQGPMLSESGHIHATHMNPALSGGNFGRWGTYRAGDPEPNKHRPIIGEGDSPCDYYQVPANGMGLFLTRRDSWPGFHQAMHQFGSEEGYMHEKFRVLGRKCWNLPFLKWWHIFKKHSVNITYPIQGEHKYRNQLIGWTEVGLPLDIVKEYWSHRLPSPVRKHIEENVESLGIQPLPAPEGYEPFLGYPIRLLDPPHSESESFVEYERPLFYNA